jgi:triosephosphate isomerase
VHCVGEKLEERDANQTFSVVQAQLEEINPALTQDPKRLVIAYEPVWAIGTGRTATPDTAATAHAALRGLLVGKFGAAGRRPRILYGGSVKPGNAAELLAAADVGGLLVGGASLEAAQFRPIIESVQESST